MKLETLISAWHKALCLEDATWPKIKRRLRGRRQTEVFWHAIQERVDDYRGDHLDELSRTIKNLCAGDHQGYWPYRKSHARAINELVAAGVMYLAQRNPPRWRFVQK